MTKSVIKMAQGGQIGSTCIN